MQRFTGNKLTGCWVFKEPGGCYNMMSVQELLGDNRIVWIMLPETGDFYWPHIQFPNQPPQEMIYNTDD